MDRQTINSQMFNFNRFLAKKRLVKRYKYLIEVDRILESYITFRIVNGGNAEQVNKARTELIQKQNEIKETERLLDFLKRLK